MRRFVRLLGLVIGMLLMSPLLGRTETGSFQVTVGGELHTISYQVFTDQHFNDLRDPLRFRFRDGASVSLEVWDGAPTRIIRKVSVEMPPTPRLPEGAELDLPSADIDPDSSGVGFFLGMSYADAYIGTFRFVFHLASGHKIRVGPFPMTLRHLPDLQNVQFLDDTTKPVITWASLPGVERYKVKVSDPDTGLALFVTNSFPASPGPIQTADLRTLPMGSFPRGWTGMEVGKRYVIRIEGRLMGPNPIPQYVTLPVTKHVEVPAPPPGQGRITRSLRWVEYTPLVAAP